MYGDFPDSLIPANYISEFPELFGYTMYNLSVPEISLHSAHMREFDPYLHRECYGRGI